MHRAAAAGGGLARDGRDGRARHRRPPSRSASRSCSPTTAARSSPTSRARGCSTRRRDHRPGSRETGFWRPQADGTLEVLIAHSTGLVTPFYGRARNLTSWEMETWRGGAHRDGADGGAGRSGSTGVVRGDLAYVDERENVERRAGALRVGAARSHRGLTGRQPSGAGSRRAPVTSDVSGRLLWAASVPRGRAARRAACRRPRPCGSTALRRARTGSTVRLRSASSGSSGQRLMRGLLGRWTRRREPADVRSAAGASGSAVTGRRAPSGTANTAVPVAVPGRRAGASTRC